ncbi:MAG: hypothetical protein ACJATL_001056 [Rickettsiales bacterium]|jgi:hypothetical protein
MRPTKYLTQAQKDLLPGGDLDLVDSSIDEIITYTNEATALDVLKLLIKVNGDDVEESTNSWKDIIRMVGTESASFTDICRLNLRGEESGTCNDLLYDVFRGIGTLDDNQKKEVKQMVVVAITKKVAELTLEKPRTRPRSPSNEGKPSFKKVTCCTLQ